MLKRIATAVFAIPLLIAVIQTGDPWFSLTVTLATLLGAWEFYRLARRKGIRPSSLVGYAWISLFQVNAFLDNLDFPVLLASLIIVAFVAIVVRPRSEDPFSDWLWTVGGVLYIGWTLSHAILLIHRDYGRELVFLALFSAFGTDTSAFFIGRLLGRRPLAPTISPGKTLEGAIGGFMGGVASCLLLSLLLGLPLELWQILVLGFILGIAHQIGDLAESSLKRSAQVKDAGALLPGHGGILDRLDSIFFSFLVVYYYSRWVLP